MDRFLHYSPDGAVAAALRGDTADMEENCDCESCKVEALQCLQCSQHASYLVPDSSNIEVDRIIRELDQ